MGSIEPDNTVAIFTPLSTMKNLLLVFLILSSLRVAAQNPYSKISFHRNADSDFFLPRLSTSADSALKIMAAVYNSQEFRDTLATFRFPCRNYSDSHRCPANCTRCQGNIIDTQTILDNLYRIPNAGLTLKLDGAGGDSFGNSLKNIFVITSHYQTVNADTKIPFSYHYAVHMCHEYMHIRGFYHNWRLRRRVDIAEQIGEIAYVILLRWYKAGIHPF